MKIELEISGGLVPALMATKYVVDVGSLPEATQNQLRDLAGRVMSAAPREMNPQLRDARSYDVTITLDGKTQNIVAYDGAVPAAMHEFIKLIKTVATPRRSPR
jgi:hypothetical protein